jgi:hypothetical protein
MNVGVTTSGFPTASNITFNGITWNNFFTCSLTTNGTFTFTDAANFSSTSTFRLQGINNTYTFNADCTVNGVFVTGNNNSSQGNAYIAGSGVVYIKGNWQIASPGATGTYTTGSGSLVMNGTSAQTLSYVGSSVGLIGANLTFNNPLISISGSSFRLTSGTYTALSTFNTGTVVFSCTGAATLALSLVTWTSALLFNNAGAGGMLTLTEDFYITGALTMGSTGINTRTEGGKIIYVGGNTIFQGAAVDTTSTNPCTVYFNGTTTQTVTFSTTTAMPIVFNNSLLQLTAGTITRSGGGFTALTSINANGTTIALTGSQSLDTRLIEWYNVNHTGALPITVTLTSDLYVSNNLTIGGSNTKTINGNKIHVRNLTYSVTNVSSAGTTEIVMAYPDSTISSVHTTAYCQNPLTIDTKGKLTFLTSFRHGVSALTYTSGSIISKGITLNLVTACIVNGFNKVPLESVTIGPTGTMSLTMDGFFRGLPGKPCVISSSSTSLPFNIVFSNGLENITSHVKIERCQISSGNLLIVTDGAINSNVSSPVITSSGNSGVRLINHSPNGVGKGLNHPPIRRYDLTGDYLVADPVYS